MAVPFIDFVGERDQMNSWPIKKGEEGLKQYWGEKNQISLDGKPRNIISIKIPGHGASMIPGTLAHPSATDEPVVWWGIGCHDSGY